MLTALLAVTLSPPALAAPRCAAPEQVASTLRDWAVDRALPDGARPLEDGLRLGLPWDGRAEGLGAISLARSGDGVGPGLQSPAFGDVAVQGDRTIFFLYGDRYLVADGHSREVEVRAGLAVGPLYRLCAWPALSDAEAADLLDHPLIEPLVDEQRVAHEEVALAGPGVTEEPASPDPTPALRGELGIGLGTGLPAAHAATLAGTFGGSVSVDRLVIAAELRAGRSALGELGGATFATGSLGAGPRLLGDADGPHLALLPRLDLRYRAVPEAAPTSPWALGGSLQARLRLPLGEHLALGLDPAGGAAFGAEGGLLWLGEVALGTWWGW